MNKNKVLAFVMGAVLAAGSLSGGAAPLFVSGDALAEGEEPVLFAEEDVESSEEAAFCLEAEEDSISPEGGGWAEIAAEADDAFFLPEAVETAPEETEAPPEETEAIPAEPREAEELTGAGPELLSPGEAEELPTGEEIVFDAEDAAAEEESFQEALLLADRDYATEAEADLALYEGNTKRHRSGLTGVNVGESRALTGSGAEEAEASLVGGGELPAVFDLRQITAEDGSLRSAVRTAPDQGANGSCWAYAATAAAEISAAVKQGSLSGIDDSETYLALFAHALRNGEGALEYTARGSLINPFLAGGTVMESGSLLTGALGPMAESGYPAMPTDSGGISAASNLGSGYAWQDPSRQASHLVTEVAFLPEPNLLDADWSWAGHDDTAVLAIKTAIAEGHGVAADVLFAGSGKYISKEWNSVYVSDGDRESTNHQIVIIGWDDSFPAESFAVRPEGDGAWICRNSWGTYEDRYRASAEAQAEQYFATWKAAYLASHAETEEDEVTVDLLARWKFGQNYPFDEDGIFYLSYYDRVYHSPMICDTEARSAFAGETLLQYDYLGMANCTSPEESERSGCEANVFRVEEAQELKRLAVFTGEAASHVRAQVYLLREDAATPEDGTKLYEAEEELRWAGYHILNVEEQVTLPAGSAFSVVVTITGPTGHPYTPYEFGGTDPCNPEYVYVTEENQAGRSYLLTDSGWVDLAVYEMEADRFYLQDVRPGNAMIRAFVGEAQAAEAEPEVPVEPETPVEPESPADTLDGDSSGSEAEGTPAGPESSGETKPGKTVTPTPIPTVVPKSVTKSTYAPLYLKGSSPSRTSVKLTWKGVSGADGYLVYGAKYGKSYKKLKTLSRSKRTWTQKGLKADTCYKYYLKAYKKYGKKQVILARSAVIYVAAAGKTYTNYKSVKLKSAKTVTLKKGQTASIRASGVKTKAKRKVPVKKKLRYESSAPSVAKVSSSGKITAKKKGTAVIRVYVQNGVGCSVTVKVK